MVGARRGRMIGGHIVGYLSGVPSLTTGDGRALAWREAGNGPPLVLHPGGPGCSGRYFGELPELQSRRTLIVLDPRGTGDSDRPADRSAYGLDDYAADVEAVREHLDVERLDLVGHSHGGFVAQAWAAAHPDGVGRLVLAGTASRFTDEIRSRRGLRIAAHQDAPYFAEALAALARQQAGDYTDDADLAAIMATAGHVLDFPGRAEYGLQGAFATAGVNADATRHFNDHVAAGMDLRPGLARVTSPTLVIAGEDDPFGGPTAREIAGALPDATLVEIPGADHFCFREPGHRAPWSAAILEFLDR